MNSIISVLKEDLRWSDAGDFTIKNGDIEDTRQSPGMGFRDECKRRIKSAMGDWKLSPKDGASLWTFEGEANDDQTWNRISYRIAAALTQGMFLTASDFSVIVAPISTDSVGIRIDFSDSLSSVLGFIIDQISVVYSLEGNLPYFVS